MDKANTLLGKVKTQQNEWELEGLDNDLVLESNLEEASVGCIGLQGTSRLSEVTAGPLGAPVEAL